MSEWTNFMKGKMAPYMKKYGGHKKAIQALSRDFKKSKKQIKKPGKKPGKKTPGKKTMPVKSHTRKSFLGW